MILLHCIRCNAEVSSESNEWASGLCGACRVQDLIKPYQAEIKRLVRKRQSYNKAGISTQNLDQQLTSYCLRAERNIAGPHPSLARSAHAAILDLLTGVVHGVLRA